MPNTRRLNRTGRAAIALAVIGVAACGKSRDGAVDPTLSADLKAASTGMASDGLELANAGNKAQVVVSAIEGGPQAAPQRAAVKRTLKPTPKPAPRVAAARTPRRAPAPVEAAPVETAPVEATPQRVEQAPVAAPSPAPVGRQPGVYKTEGEIFKQMPWIRP